MVNRILKMEISIRDSIYLENFMGKGHIIGVTDQLTKASLKMEWGTEKDYGNQIYIMEISMKDSIKMTWSMDMEFINGQMVLHTKVIFIEIKSMGRGFWLIKMEKYLIYNGKMEM